MQEMITGLNYLIDIKCRLLNNKVCILVLTTNYV